MCSVKSRKDRSLDNIVAGFCYCFSPSSSLSFSLTGRRKKSSILNLPPPFMYNSPLSRRHATTMNLPLLHANTTTSCCCCCYPLTHTHAHTLSHPHEGTYMFHHTLVLSLPLIPSPSPTFRLTTRPSIQYLHRATPNSSLHHASTPSTTPSLIFPPLSVRFITLPLLHSLPHHTSQGSCSQILLCFASTISKGSI